MIPGIKHFRPQVELCGFCGHCERLLQTESQLLMPRPLRTVAPLFPKYPATGAGKQAVSNHSIPLLRTLFERRPLRPSQTRLGNGLIKALPVWLGAVRITGCPVANVVMADSDQPPITMLAHPGKFAAKVRSRSNGSLQTKLPITRWRTLNVAGPFEHWRQFDICLMLRLD
jgi:hypothetical protein